VLLLSKDGWHGEGLVKGAGLHPSIHLSQNNTQDFEFTVNLVFSAATFCNAQHIEFTIKSRVLSHYFLYRSQPLWLKKMKRLVLEHILMLLLPSMVINFQSCHRWIKVSKTSVKKKKNALNLTGRDTMMNV
jgi:hypothetical protein